MRTPLTLAAVAFLLLLTLLSPPAGAADAPAWVNISDPLVKQLEADSKKQDWPGNTASEENVVGTPRPDVGSNGIQPMPSKYTSGQACSCELYTEYTG